MKRSSNVKRSSMDKSLEKSYRSRHLAEFSSLRPKNQRLKATFFLTPMNVNPTRQSLVSSVILLTKRHCLVLNEMLLVITMNSNVKTTFTKTIVTTAQALVLMSLILAAFSIVVQLMI